MSSRLSAVTGWIEDLVGHVQTTCGYCGTVMATHMYGYPLTVCPRCFPTEKEGR